MVLLEFLELGNIVEYLDIVEHGNVVEHLDLVEYFLVLVEHLELLEHVVIRWQYWLYSDMDQLDYNDSTQHHHHSHLKSYSIKHRSLYHKTRIHANFNENSNGTSVYSTSSVDNEKATQNCRRVSCQ